MNVRVAVHAAMMSGRSAYVTALARCRVAGASHSSYRRYDPPEMATDEVPETARVREALPAILAAHPAVAAIIERSCLLLHGSTTIGMGRPASDWDLWVLTDDATRA